MTPALETFLDSRDKGAPWKRPYQQCRSHPGLFVVGCTTGLRVSAAGSGAVRGTPAIQVRFSRFLGTVQRGPAQRQETQIVQSCNYRDMARESPARRIPSVVTWAEREGASRLPRSVSACRERFSTAVPQSCVLLGQPLHFVVVSDAATICGT